MIAEDYVSFETAKLLKEKRFNEPCYAYWHEDENRLIISQSMYPIKNITNPCFFGPAAPTLQMAMKWLREVHNIAINIGWGEVFEKDYRWWCIIISQKNGEILRDSEYHKTYEKACEAAIKYCLENLI